MYAKENRQMHKKMKCKVPCKFNKNDECSLINPTLEVKYIKFSWDHTIRLPVVMCTEFEEI